MAAREAQGHTGLVIHLTRPLLRGMLGSAGVLTPLGCHQLPQSSSTHLPLSHTLGCWGCSCRYDPGYTSTASCASDITYIDGGKGILLYRGYPIEQLAESADFVDAAFLLLAGSLPNQTRHSEFLAQLR
jgi:hypothetical protein